MVLKKSNEVKFNQLWATFAKSEVNAMRFSEFMQFIIDRCLITNKITIGQFYELFLSATGKRASHEPAPTNLASSVIPVHEKTIQRFEFRFLLNELGKYVYHNDKNQQDRVYNDLLSEKSLA